MKALLACLALTCALPAPLLAEAPELAPRPAARPLPEAPGRPAARPGETRLAGMGDPVAEAAPPPLLVPPLLVPPLRQVTAGDASPARPPAGPAAAPDRRSPARPLAPAQMAAAVEPAAEAAGPDATLADAPPAPDLSGSSAPAYDLQVLSTMSVRPERLPSEVLIQADLRMQPAILDLPGDWTGKEARLRPGYLARLAVQPMALAPARPALRPHQPWMDVVQAPDLEQGDAGDGAEGVTVYAVAAAFRPPDRPESLVQRVAAQQAERQRGALCGAVGLQGDRLGAISGPGACGVEDAVRVRSVGGIQLSQPLEINCDTARALLGWVESSAIPTFRHVGGGLERLEIMGGYTCRGRNGTPGARLSEHSFGNAVDIGGFRMRDGSRITLLGDWRGTDGGYLRTLWQAACGPFGTVLGPNANAAHRDHFHFDTAAYRSGSYCR
ncbi:extensin family protein [Wenxinia saemankumensis]|uniref:Uncharacterized conserved protein n=1 Tax=Wenxinia saemankumensis TaxID=1447782 RepID=A0A1M6BSQ0_9RHOB|nr:extensin family protein [Wenxinia saemankumensis]SHI51746.1 Uncharacterized conserved protein [Wenxinia saemankumensis]